MTKADKEGSTAIQPYLFFGGRCEEALEFYKKALDAKVDFMMKFGEAPDQPPPGTIPEGFKDKVMHANFRIRGTTLMASDGCGEEASFKGFSLSISVGNENEAKRVFNALAEGGKVEMPLGKTFFSPCYGMLTDKFGMQWMVIVPQEMASAAA